MSHKNAQMFFRVYFKWIDGESNHWEKAKMAALFADHLPSKEAVEDPKELALNGEIWAQERPKIRKAVDSMARPTGIEPVSRASETLILSIELRAQRKEAVLYPVLRDLHELDQIFRQTHRKPVLTHWTIVPDTVI